MRHARAEDLERAEGLLAALRAIPSLRERSSGVFYLRSRAFLHFHEDGGRLFADVRLNGTEFDRLPATTVAQQRTLLRRIQAALVQ